ncbi:sigma-70 family RNA polymerase sigma factor [Nocardiopsis sp. MG754419]|uniref:sigma-70 family RNA polymerase sigma factor n=1 Tax=Nocardiopsis sp. MG754419 TaxID=2259865 RepID=UPI001BA6B971|nr:sigma-70 family RNA polymerase sigma factor [Nocardiopsis sp. MG754419]MBR8742010.1 sigma-70 family RNA polymerase sigma factor [Nocardiopsis sp. MG754419]
MTDQDLLHTLRSGRTRPADVYARLLDVYGEDLYRHCVLVLRDRDTAHVVLRDTLIVARAHSARLEDAERLGAWLHALAEAECGRHRSRAAGGDGARRPAPRGSDGLVRVRVLSGMTRPELDGYRTHVAVRADRFGPDGFPLRPGTRHTLRGVVFSPPAARSLMLWGALVLLLLLGGT